jgi:hypothetical protein
MRGEIRKAIVKRREARSKEIREARDERQQIKG